MGKGRRVLGRGLEALIPTHASAVREVRLGDIVPSRSQPRTSFDEATISQLAESIRTHGIIQPLVVTPPDETGKRRLIAGERRWQAASQAGLETVPVVERVAGAQDAMEIALIENIQREDLSPLEEASAFERLAREHSLSQEEIATRVGRSRSSVANTIRLLNLPTLVRESLARRDITEGHARALLGLDDHAVMEAALLRIVRGGLNVRQAERLVASLRQGTKTRAVHDKSAEWVQLESDLRNALGTKVSVVKGRKAGRIVIEYYSEEELESLVDRLLSGG